MPAIGAIVAFAGPKVPTGFLLCDGNTYDRTKTYDGVREKYKALFNAIGTSWGGDGVNLFRVPDLRGLFLRGVDAGAGRDPQAGERTAMFPGDKNPGNKGDAVGSFQPDQFREHSHSVIATPHRDAGRTGQRDGWYAGGESGTGNAGGKETRPVNAAVLWIIRYQ